MVAYDATERTVDDSFSEIPAKLHPPPQGRKSHTSRRASSHSHDDVLDVLYSSYCESASSEFAPSVHGDAERRNAGQLELAEREARHVWWSKLLVAVVLIVSASLLGYFTYTKTQEAEVNEFENQASVRIKGFIRVFYYTICERYASFWVYFTF
jgi:hypothetical protein